MKKPLKIAGMAVLGILIAGAGGCGHRRFAKAAGKVGGFLLDAVLDDEDEECGSTPESRAAHARWEEHVNANLGKKRKRS